MSDLPKNDGALAQSVGEGVQIAPLPAKKKEKVMDWGAINRLLENFFLIYGTSTVYDNETKRIMLLRDLRNIFGDAVKFWLDSPRRKMVLNDHLVFDPTFVGHVINEDAADYFDNQINLFYGLEVAPKKGNCKLILAHILRLCGGDAACADWVLKWTAYPLQNMGAKMRTSVVMHGEEGTGKNIFWEDIVAKIYGQYGIVITQSQIENQFTGWISCKLFAVADEVVSQAEKRHIKGRLKYYITGGQVSVNEKNLPERWEKNHMNFVFLSNDIQPLLLDSGDRRYTTVWCDDVPDKAYFDALVKEVENGGLEAFYAYLRALPLYGFNEHTKPYENKARKDLIQLGRSSTQRFFGEWEAESLPVDFVCARAGDLYRAFIKWCSENGEKYQPSSTQFGREMSRYIPKKENIKLYFGTKNWQGHVYEPIPPPPEVVQATETKKHIQNQCDTFLSQLNDWGK